MKKTHPTTTALKIKEGDQEPKGAGGLSKVKKAKKRTPHWNLPKEHSFADTF